MTEPAMVHAAMSDALRHIVADLFPDWTYQDGDVVRVRQVPAADAALVWMKRGDTESAPAIINGDAIRTILAAMLNHTEEAGVGAPKNML